MNPPYWSPSVEVQDYLGQDHHVIPSIVNRKMDIYTHCIDFAVFFSHNDTYDPI
jgi:hypothetical protein